VGPLSPGRFGRRNSLTQLINQGCLIKTMSVEDVSGLRHFLNFAFLKFLDFAFKQGPKVDGLW
jgi:hypothetical protein